MPSFWKLYKAVTNSGTFLWVITAAAILCCWAAGIAVLSGHAPSPAHCPGVRALRGSFPRAQDPFAWQCWDRSLLVWSPWSAIPALLLLAEIWGPKWFGVPGKSSPAHDHKKQANSQDQDTKPSILSYQLPNRTHPHAPSATHLARGSLTVFTAQSTYVHLHKPYGPVLCFHCVSCDWGHHKCLLCISA